MEIVEPGIGRHNQGNQIARFLAVGKQS